MNLLFHSVCSAQQPKAFTRADTLRGTVSEERSWWDVQRYDISVRPDYPSKTIAAKSVITYKVTGKQTVNRLQLDLQEPLIIDSILLDKKHRVGFKRDGNAWHVEVPSQQKNSEHTLAVFYKGKVHEAKRAPWDGGWIWATDSLGRPWMTVACQGLGASVWFPCKDHQSDEPDKGASLTMTVPDTLIAIGNGRLQSKKQNNDGTATYTYAVTNPISTYCIIPYIGKYANFKETYKGEKGDLDINYWALDYNLDIARSYMPKEVHNMLNAFEFWFGPYPFYEDGYQLIETSHTGMEHQSAVSYGNWYKPGYRGRDGSGTGIGMKWDFIIIHESGHEWFGNNITTKDLADMWVHEGFTNYSETMFVDYVFGKESADAYNKGTRRGIRNDKNIIPDYNVNAQGSGDMYPKAGNMIHSIRHGLNDDTLFRKIMRGLNKTFYHQTVTTQQIENYVSQTAKFNYSKVFDQYLRTTQIPALEFIVAPDKASLRLRYANCVNGFNLPITLTNGKEELRLLPTDKWQTVKLKAGQAALVTSENIENMFYVKPVLLKE
ncbi:MAG: M1 family metallopeptidase [Chitinophagaceae bacterium]